jgi:hypothetical protein
VVISVTLLFFFTLLFYFSAEFCVTRRPAATLAQASLEWINLMLPILRQEMKKLGQTLADSQCRAFHSQLPKLPQVKSFSLFCLRSRYPRRAERFAA